MAEVAGLAMGAIGLTALFTTCIDTFDIVITARDFNYDYEILCVNLSLQRLRFCLWGERVGLVARNGARRPPWNPRLDDPDIGQTLARTLIAIHHLLKETGRFRDRFSLGPRSSRELVLFNNLYDEFRNNVDRPAPPTPKWKAVKWAVYGKDKFSERIEQLKGLIDGLEQVAEAIGAPNDREARMEAEIETLDDARSLRLIRDATATAAGSASLAETASVRLLMIEGPTGPTGPEGASAVGTSFYTAPLEQEDHAIDDLDAQPGDDSRVDEDADIPQNSRVMANLGPFTRPWRPASRTTDLSSYGAKLKAYDIQELATTGDFPPSLSYIRSTIAGICNDIDPWIEDPPNLPDQLSGRKRIMKELERSTRSELEDPAWVMRYPIRENAKHFLAAIEGPPETPYEAGVFWLYILMPRDYPFKPPRVRFLTRIYHPNIDSTGNLCLDILEGQWHPALTIAQALVSICSILDAPGLDDPLVPEIAEIYCRDYELYCRNARTYTDRYAMAENTHSPTFSA